MRIGLSLLVLAGMLLVVAGCGGTDPVSPSIDMIGNQDLRPEEPDQVDALPEFLPELDSMPETLTCEPGQPCDDGDPCTDDDLCKGGFCTGTAYTCDDGLKCTTDTCLGGGECDYSVRDGFCLVQDTCYEDGEGPDDAPCIECITAVAQDELTPNNGNTCDDGDACTTDDHCAYGLCTGVPLPCPADGPCASNSCVDGECVAEPLDGPCDDGDACTTDDTCVAGQCIGGEGLLCVDDNPCTDDACDPITGCQYIPNDAPCDDGNACTVNDHCIAGACGFDEFLACDDANPCTDDACHPEQGCLFFPNNGPCDDGDPCLMGDFCAAGTCQPGGEPLLCDDDNLCTDDSCVPGEGCLFAPNSNPCDDGDVCFADDHCAQGECVPGPDVLDCDDGNVCTADSCEPFVGCLHEPVAGACDDGTLCTEGDACVEGECVGNPVVCDDDNICTADSCKPDSGCLFLPLNTKACRPQIVISWPPRGATLDGDPNITVTGTVTSQAGDITSFTINGEPVLMDAEGAFSHPMASSQGMNLIIAEAADSLGGTSRTSPSYYFSYDWYAIDAADPQQSMVPDGIMVFLGPEVWDDNDTGDVDDMATIMTLYLQNLELGSLIQNPVATGTQGWCSYSVNISNITYGNPSVDLIPVAGGLHMAVTIPNFKANIQMNMSGFLCPSGSGTATASSITIDAEVQLWMQNGELKAQMANTAVSVNNLDISLDGVLGFLLNWLINFFEDSFADQIEASFQDQLGSMIPATIVQALNSLALDQDIEIPPFMGDGDPVTLQMKTGLYSVDFTPQGGTLGLQATVVVPKNVDHDPLGSIGRAACLSAQSEAFAFPQLGQLEIGLFDDFFNQLTFGMYWGGLFAMDVDPAELGVDLGAYGLSDVQLHVDFLLPAVMTSCTEDDTLVMQIGDIRVDGSMTMAGQPVNMTIYASLEVEAEIISVDKPDGTKELSASLGAVRIMEVEIAEVTGALEGLEDMLLALIEENLVGGLLDSLSGGALGSFPVPDIDLSGFDPSIPPGTSITMDLQEILRIVGYTVLSGNVK